MRKIKVGWLLAAILIFSMLVPVSTYAEKEDRPDDTTYVEEVQPLRMRFSESYAVIEDGLFYLNGNGFLHFYDRVEDTSVIVCRRTDCRHGKDDDCDADLQVVQTIFVVAEKLYTIERAYDPAADDVVARVVSSNLDRSDQTVLMHETGVTISSVLFNETTLFGVMTFVEIEKPGPIGQPDLPTGRASHLLFSLDLDTGTYRELASFPWQHSSSMQLCGLSGSKLYFVRQDASEKTYEAGSFDYSPAALKLYRGQFAFVDLASHEMTPVFLETEPVPWLSIAYLRDGSIYFYDRREPENYASPRDLKRLDLSTNLIEMVLSPEDNLRQWGDDFFFIDKEDLKAYHVNLISGEKKVIEQADFTPYAFVEYEPFPLIVALKKLPDDRQWEAVRLDRESFLNGTFDRASGRYALEEPLDD